MDERCGVRMVGNSGVGVMRGNVTAAISRGRSQGSRRAQGFETGIYAWRPSVVETPAEY